MLSPGITNQNNPRLALSNSQLFSNFNNLNNMNNNQMMKDININRINQAMNNNMLFQREQQQNYFNDMNNNNFMQRINGFMPNNINNIPFNMQYNNMGNTNQNMLNYQQYLNMSFPKK